jgi:hypothetical protein
MTRWRLTRRFAALLTVAALVGAGCGRSGSSSSSSSTTAKAATTASGDFGTLKAVCGPGNAKGATDVGVTDTAIDVSTIFDPGFTGAPGSTRRSSTPLTPLWAGAMRPEASSAGSWTW